MKRKGLAIGEIIVTLAVLSVAAGILAQTAAWAIQERQAIETRDMAFLLVENIAEMARATPWNELDSHWAADLKLPEEIIGRWAKSTMTVSVEPDHGMKRVQISIRLDSDHVRMSQSATLTVWVPQKVAP